jgi:hypothetical protein
MGDVQVAFDDLERPVARKNTCFSITFNGIKLILIITITPISYLGNRALVA